MSSSTPRAGKKPDRATKAKIAEQRARQRRADRRRRIITVVGSVIGIAAIVGALVAIKVTHNGSSGSSTAVAVNPAPAAVVNKVTTVPAAVLTSVGAGTVKSLPQPVQGDKLTKDGKPEVLYVGAEYCPFCGGERWALINALSRFGTFDNLKITQSAKNDSPSDIHTFSFRDAKYTSDYVAFTGVETQTSDTAAGPPAPLHKLTKAQQALYTKYNTGGGIPFLDFANQYASSGASFDVSGLQGMTWQQIADQLDQPDSDVAKGIVGAANALTATICKITDNNPGDVCNTPTITALQKQLSTKK